MRSFNFNKISFVVVVVVVVSRGDDVCISVIDPIILHFILGV